MIESLTITNLLKQYHSKKPNQPTPKTVWQDPLYFIGFGLGSGAIPFAPGTFGTLMAVPFYLMARALSLPLYLVILAFFVLFSIWICEKLSQAIHLHDHPGMCIDEFAGFFVTMINAPQGAIWIILGFVLFRLFDIWKPGPIRYLDEHLHGGVGMVLDDVLAGVFAMIIIQILAMFFT